MKHLITYLECGEDCATSSNTLGMGNPGKIDQNTLSEPVGGMEKTAKVLKQNDRKKKKKIKSLTESLFDTNLTSKDILFGDILELDTWECANLDDYNDIGAILDITFSAKLKNNLIKRPKWKDFLSPLKSIYNKSFGDLYIKQRHRYIDCWQFWMFTWIIMCCSSLKEISIKLNEFMEGIRRFDYVFDEDFYIKKIDIVPLEGMGDMKGMPSLVVIKFKIKDKDIVIYMKLKKRD